MKALYFDLFSGLSGDMTLGALLDTAGGEDTLKTELSKLGLDSEFSLEIKKVDKLGVAATSVTVLTQDDDAHHHDQEHHHNHSHEHEHERSDEHARSHAHGRSFKDIRALIDASSLSSAVKQTSLRAFTLLAEAEGRPVTREQFLDAVWGYTAFPTTRTVDNHIAALRAKLEKTPDAPRWLKTLHGVGYKLEQ